MYGLRIFPPFLGNEPPKSGVRIQSREQDIGNFPAEKAKPQFLLKKLRPFEKAVFWHFDLFSKNTHPNLG